MLLQETYQLEEIKNKWLIIFTNVYLLIAPVHSIFAIPPLIGHRDSSQVNQEDTVETTYKATT